VLFFADIGTQN